MRLRGFLIMSVFFGPVYAAVAYILAAANEAGRKEANRVHRANWRHPSEGE